MVRLSVDELGSTANLVSAGTMVIQPLAPRRPRDPATWEVGSPAIAASPRERARQLVDRPSPEHVADSDDPED